MFLLRKRRSGSANWKFSLCRFSKKKFNLLFSTLMRAEEGTSLETLPQTEEGWKLMKNIVSEAINFDSNSSVTYEDKGNIVLFHKSAFAGYELEFLNEEIAKAFVEELRKRIQKAEQVTKINRTNTWYTSGNTLGRSSKWSRKSGRKSKNNLLSSTMKRNNVILKKPSKRELLDVDDNTDFMRLKPKTKNPRFNNSRGMSVDDLKVSLKDYLLQTDTIAVSTKSYGTLSKSTFNFSKTFNRSKKAHLPFVASDSFRTENEYKTNKTELEREFLAKCFVDLTTLHGVFLRDFDELAMEKLIQKAYKVKFEPGEDVVVIGQIWDEFYIVNEGEVKLVEREVNLWNEGLKESHQDKHSVLTKGSSFGIMCLLNPELSNINAKAITKTSLWALRKKTFEQIRNQNSERQEEKKEIFLRKILKQVNIKYFAEESFYLKNYMDIKAMSEGDRFTPPRNDETIVLCFSGVIDIVLEGEYSHSLHENMVHGLKYLEEVHFKGNIPDIVFVAKRKSIILLVEAQELRLMLATLRLKQKQQGKQRLKEQIPTSGATTINKLAKIFTGLKYRGSTSSKFDQSKETMVMSKSGLSIISRPQCIDLETSDCPARIPEMDINNFRFVSAIGEGNFGAVYVTLYRFDGKDEVYVMKVVSREGSFDSVTKFNKLNREKQIMAELTQNTEKFCCGGDVGQLMTSQESGAFSERTMKFYLACIVLGLEEIHGNHVIYRDMKPDNVFIDERGYCKIGDFGISKKSQRTYTFWGTLEYQAPEMILNYGYNSSVDIWGLGIVAFELVYGFTPFMAHDRDRPGIILNTVEHKQGGLTKDRIDDLVDEFAPTNCDYGELSAECLDFINMLLAPNPARRLGCGFGDGTEDIKAHSFLREVEWKKLLNKEIVAPWIPEEHNFNDSCKGPEFSPILPSEEGSIQADVNTIIYADS